MSTTTTTRAKVHEESMLKVLGNPRLFDEFFRNYGHRAVLLTRAWSARIDETVRVQHKYWTKRMQAFLREPKEVDVRKLRNVGGDDEQDETYEDIELLMDGVRRRAVLYATIRNMLAKHSVLRAPTQRSPFEVYFVLCSIYRFYKSLETNKMFERSAQCAFVDLERVAFYSVDKARTEVELLTVRGAPASPVHLRSLRVYTDQREYEQSTEPDRCLLDSNDSVCAFEFDASRYPEQQHLIYEYGNEQDFKDTIGVFVRLDPEQMAQTEQMCPFNYNVIAIRNEARQLHYELPKEAVAATADKDKDDDDDEFGNQNFLVVNDNNATSSVRKLFWTVPHYVEIDALLRLLQELFGEVYVAEWAETITRENVLADCEAKGQIVNGRFVDGAVDGQTFGTERADSVLDQQTDWEQRAKLRIAKESQWYPQRKNHCLLLDQTLEDDPLGESAKRSLLHVVGFCNTTALFNAEEFSTQQFVLWAHSIEPTSRQYRLKGQHAQMQLELEAMQRQWAKSLKRVQEYGDRFARDADYNRSGTGEGMKQKHEFYARVKTTCETVDAQMQAFFEQMQKHFIDVGTHID